jgi:hypothetical protein
MSTFDTMPNAIQKIRGNTDTTVDCSNIKFLAKTQDESDSLCNALEDNTVLKQLYLPCLSYLVLWPVCATLFKVGSPLRRLSFGRIINEPWYFCFEVDQELRRLKVTARTMQYRAQNHNPTQLIFALLGTLLAADTRFRELNIHCIHGAPALFFEALEQNKALEHFDWTSGDLNALSTETLIRLILSPNRTLKTLDIPMTLMCDKNLITVGEALKKTPRQSGFWLNGIQLYRVAASLGFGHCETNQRLMDAMLESWTQKLLALAMATHPRLGKTSPACDCGDAMSIICKLYWGLQ